MNHKQMVASYLADNHIEALINSAVSAEKTIDCWRCILPLYFPTIDKFIQTSIANMGTNIVITLPHPPQKTAQISSQCVIMVSAGNYNMGQPLGTWDVQKRAFFDHLRSLVTIGMQRETYGVLALGPLFVLFKVTRDHPEPQYLIGTKWTPEHLHIYHIVDKLESTLHGIKIAAMDCSFMLAHPTPEIGSTRVHDLTSNGIYRNQQNIALIQASTTSQSTICCWKSILRSYIGERNTALSISEHDVESAHFVSLDYHDTDSRTQAPVTQPRCLVLVETTEPVRVGSRPEDEHQWDVSRSRVWSILKDMVTSGSEEQGFGVIASGRLFVLFRVTGKPQTCYCYWFNSSSIPQDLLDERTGAYMDLAMNYIIKSSDKKTFKPWDPDHARLNERVTRWLQGMSITSPNLPAGSVPRSVSRASSGSETLSDSAHEGSMAPVHIFRRDTPHQSAGRTFPSQSTENMGNPFSNVQFLSQPTNNALR